MSAPTLDQSTLDRLAIRELIDQSSDLINHQQWNALLGLFTDDIVWERLPPTPWKLAGHDAVLGFLTKNESTLDVLLYTVAAS